MKTKEEKVEIAQRVATILIDNNLTYAEGIEILFNVMNVLVNGGV